VETTGGNDGLSDRRTSEVVKSTAWNWSEEHPGSKQGLNSWSPTPPPATFS